MPQRDSGLLDPERLLRTLGRWKWFIAALAVVAAATSGFASLQLPKVYEATATALVSPKQVIPTAANSVDSNALPNTDQLVLTYAALINAQPVRDQLVKDGVPRSSASLQGSLKIKRQTTTTLIEISADDSDPDVALAIARDVIPAFNRSLNDLQSATAGVDKSSQLAALVAWEVPTEAPVHPVSPNIPLNTLAGGAVGLILAITLTFWFDRLDKSIRSEVDVRSRLNVALLGTIPAHDSGPGAGALQLISAQSPKDPVAEQYRQLRTNVLFSNIDNPPRLIGLTSTAPGEGKTTTACNLAITMAQAGHEVILVDADFRRPSLHKVFGMVNVGLGDLLLGAAPDDTLIVESGIPKLRVVCTGPLPPNPSELLGSVAMRNLAEKLSTLAGIVIFDTPPAAVVTDAAVLGQLCDAMILVVGSGETASAAIGRVIESMHAVRVPLIGAVLNKVPLTSENAYQYQYYYAEAPGESDAMDSSRRRALRKARARAGKPGAATD